MFLRLLPAALTSRLRVAPVYLVASTIRSRSPARNSPRNVSLRPPLYRFAVSTKLPPASRKPSYRRRLSSFSTPHPGMPKVIAPSASSETRRPLLPSSRYFIVDSPREGRTGYPDRVMADQPEIVDIEGLDRGEAAAI